jgi:hypothetical protein
MRERMVPYRGGKTKVSSRSLSGGPDDVVDWLGTNGYQMSAEAPALFQDYVARGYLFVAVKLTGGAGIDEIHPLVVRYAGSKPD